MAPLRPGLCPLLTDEITKKLHTIGIKSVSDFVCEPAQRLSKRAELPYEAVHSIRQSLLCQYGGYPVSGCELWQEEKVSSTEISTGCRNLDQLLGGGVVTGHVTEICGPPASGKTQLCLSVTGSVAMTTGCSVVYVDSGCGFSSTRLMQMLSSRGLKDESAVELLRKVKVHRITNIFELMELLHNLQENIAQQINGFYSNLRLVILDSITFFISPLLGGRQFHGHALMTQVSMAMKTLAHAHSVAVLYSNNVVVDFKGSVTGGGVKPALGRTWTYVPSTRIMLNQQPDGVRCATLVKSSRQPTGTQVEFLVRENGLESFTRH